MRAGFLFRSHNHPRAAEVLADVSFCALFVASWRAFKKVLCTLIKIIAFGRLLRMHTGSSMSSTTPFWFSRHSLVPAGRSLGLKVIRLDFVRSLPDVAQAHSAVEPEEYGQRRRYVGDNGPGPEPVKVHLNWIGICPPGFQGVDGPH